MSSSCSSIPSSTQTATTSSDSPSTEQETHHLLWSRSRVYVHPTPYSRDNVPGYLALVRKGPSTPRATIYLSYLPEALLQERDEVDKFVKVEKRRGAGAGAKGKERAAQSDAIADDIGDEDVQVTAVDVWDPGESVREKGSWKRGESQTAHPKRGAKGIRDKAEEINQCQLLFFSLPLLSLSSPETLLKTPSESGFSVNSKRSTTSTTSPTSYAVSIPLSQLHSFTPFHLILLQIFSGMESEISDSEFGRPRGKKTSLDSREKERSRSEISEHSCLPLQTTRMKVLVEM